MFVGMALASLTFSAVAAPTPFKGAAKEGVQVQTPLSGAGAASSETNLGNLIADAVRQTGRAQFALVPADEIGGKAPIPAGRTDPNTIIAALRYADDPSDTVVVLNLTEAQLVKVAARSVSRSPEPFDGFLQVSGLQIHARPGQSPTLTDSDGGKLDSGRTYRVATTRPIAGGSLGYFQIWTPRDIAEDTGVPLAKSLGAYLAAHKTINSVVEGRISTR